MESKWNQYEGWKNNPPFTSHIVEVAFIWIPYGDHPPPCAARDIYLKINKKETRKTMIKILDRC